MESRDMQLTVNSHNSILIFLTVNFTTSVPTIIPPEKDQDSTVVLYSLVRWYDNSLPPKKDQDSKYSCTSLVR